ncbi:EF-P lysine aminoacylase EpmA [Ignatzschineria rhizosphaerae]|uniref:EF-P lysine aminoacylase EpmA n=1 Tax=Ignatzschineria rhizosphaerae TaxID=2923279 RepID=A0ABY3X891_9GAMM|nr:EF-P lysine aminoacylase EpmA [Ignatzschineria rhizosphaerae]UNM96975.1 EF-P lysine aminoacylase EpmA [Ignatzschineria rhizosphaerae]
MAVKAEQVTQNQTLQEKLWFRGQILRTIRDYFFEEKVVEVDTPIMSQFGNPDPALLNFITPYNGPGKLYQHSMFLITSPEYHMKRLLAYGAGSCYYLGKVFRDGEISKRHNPEFTMLEWYRLDYDLERLMQEVISLIKLVSGKALEVEFYSYLEAFKKILGVNPFEMDLEALVALIQAQNIALTFELRDRDEALDLIVSHLIEPAFDPEKITMLYHYPASQASLSKIVTIDGYPVGKRFEAYWQGLELANGYEELTNSQEQRARFMAENIQRTNIGYDAVPIDELLLEVLDQVPFCSGVALGVDRLLMAMKGSSEIKDVIPFGFEES